jgi:class 3 adenylate cyclase/pimeloyl-ACP methyl ester carboxylesterase
MGPVSSGVWSRTSDVSYARVDDSHVAYRVIVGDCSAVHDVVLVMGGTVSMEALFEDPIGARLLEGLASLGRLVVFDRRGIGLSDPPVDVDSPYTTRWSDDISAVVAAAQVARAVLVSGTISWTPTVVYCDRHPDDVAAMVSLEPSPPFRLPPDIIRGQIAGEIDSVALFCPSRANEPGFREWFTRAGRVGASPALAANAYPTFTDDEAREIEHATARITAPMLVLRRPASRYSPPAESDPVVTLVPGAMRIELPGEDLMIYGGEVDALLAESTRFITGEHRLPAPECALMAVMFSDVVASTEQASALGGERWKRLLDRHDQLARTCVGRRGGTVIKTTGDGILATLPSAISTFRAAQELRTVLAEEGLDIRVGIHVGDIDHRGDDISGLAVNIAARITHLAAPGEILVSRTVTDLIAGPTIAFTDRGEHELKGVPGTWRLFAINRT